MAHEKLTDASVQRLKPPAKGQADYWDRNTPGLGLRIGQGGSKTWIVQARVLKEGIWKQTRRVIGHYPAMSLATARDTARSTLATIAKGDDPKVIAVAIIREKEQTSAQSFDAMADEFLAKHVARKLKDNTAAAYRLALKGHDARPWHERPITDINRRDVHDLLDTIVERGDLIAANRRLAYLRKFFGWCVERGYLETAPTDHVKPPAKNVARDRALTMPEVVEVWRAADAMGGPFGPLFKLLLLTGQRRNEVAEIRWDELTLDGRAPVWDLPGTRTKNSLPNRIPLPPAAVNLLLTLPRIFNSPFVLTTNGTSPISGFSKAKADIDRRIAAAREAAGLPSPMPGWTIHDLRRTVSTRLHDDLEVAPHIVEAALNHISGNKAGVAGTYNRASYIAQKRAAFEGWAKRIESQVRRYGYRLAVGKAVVIQRGKVKLHPRPIQ